MWRLPLQRRQPASTMILPFITLVLLSLLGIPRAVDPVTWQRNEHGVE